MVFISSHGPLQKNEQKISPHWSSIDIIRRKQKTIKEKNIKTRVLLIICIRWQSDYT